MKKITCIVEFITAKGIPCANLVVAENPAQGEAWFKENKMTRGEKFLACTPFRASPKPGMPTHQVPDGWQPATPEDPDIDFMLSFCAPEVPIENELAQNQLLALWTAHCLRKNLGPDTREYADQLTKLWAEVSTNEGCPWDDYGDFDIFMGGFLA